MARATLSSSLVALSVLLLLWQPIGSQPTLSRANPTPRWSSLTIKGKTTCGSWVVSRNRDHEVGSGLLAPGKSVGKHTTGQHEELLVILEGKGETSFADGSKLPVEAAHALYCPPETEHDVTNTGTGTLRYVYVVAAAK